MAQAYTQQDFEVNLPSRDGWIGKTVQFVRTWPILPIVILAVMTLVAVLAPLVSPHDPLFSTLRSRNAPPVWYADGTWTYILGADHIGRDLLSRLFYGARISQIGRAHV